jgi:hypothetical protein
MNLYTLGLVYALIIGLPLVIALVTLWMFATLPLDMRELVIIVGIPLLCVGLAIPDLLEARRLRKRVRS